ncbi:hypothetical protein NOF55_20235 [Rhizobiaceae bacterium BDR2-2]|uniref:Uncharacterized protein n=1 Tax=Ectorhizobium quercum TaxID=2965071 RepID=A0AAE3N6H7_9HYPH|nr:hypothetical protein [Ectorhizobium quercum]MCX8999437.1 hypothetical protein [Ectorhizobium quercum]
MRWIITKDHWGGCMGLGENADGAPARGRPEDGEALPMEFRLYDPRGKLLFEGRCGDIDEDWWHGFEPLIYLWNPFRARRLYYRRAGMKKRWRPFRQP